MIKGQAKKNSGIPKTLVLEAQFQETVIEMAETYGWECFYIRDSKRSAQVERPHGWPDLVLCHPVMNILIYAELKTDDLSESKLSPDQVKWLTMLENYGEIVQVWRPQMWPHIEGVLQGPELSTWDALNEEVGRFVKPHEVEL